MQRFVNAMNGAVATCNWYAALSLALTIPDICGRLDDQTAGSRARFEAWFDKFLLSRYQSPVGPSGRLHTFLCGSDCYALRCAYLHQGEFDIDDQRAQQALAQFHFTVPRHGMTVHRNQFDNMLQLQVDIFCSDVSAATEEWLEAVKADAGIQGRMAKLAVIGQY